LCRIYRLSETELPFDNSASSVTIVDAAHLSVTRADFAAVERDGVNGLLRRHTPGIALILTQQCNLGCSYCLAKQGTFGLPVAQMKVDDVKRQIESLFGSSPDIDFVKFFGGEPTLKFGLIEEICDFITEDL